MNPLYADPLFRNLATDPRDRPILADWLDERGHDEYAQCLRQGTGILPPLDDSDWEEAFTNGIPPKATPPGSTVPEHAFAREDVRRVIALSEGENDGFDWVVVGELWDGRFFSLRAWCDNTGWH